ncbi:unnamed protein product [Closterium sp. NIES-65]|nr:unnamed protein product [Closterium sp. NIES-65]
MALPTSELFNRYFFSDILGEGQSGRIWRCQDRITGETLACKQVRKRGMSHVELADLRREVQSMLILRGHPNVLCLRGLYEDDKAVYMITELCAGGDLFALIAEHEGLEESVAARLFVQLARAVRWCHINRVVHRDIKPENILIVPPSPAVSPNSAAPAKRGGKSDNGSSSPSSSPASLASPASADGDDTEKSPRLEDLQLRLADFGLAFPLQPGSAIIGAAGSAPYEAPEVLAHEPYNYCADIWSLGVLLYAMLSANWPAFPNDSRKLLPSDLLPKPWPSISFEAKDLIRRMLTADPMERIDIIGVLEHPWLKKQLAPPRLDAPSLAPSHTPSPGARCLDPEEKKTEAEKTKPFEPDGFWWMSKFRGDIFYITPDKKKFYSPSQLTAYLESYNRNRRNPLTPEDFCISKPKWREVHGCAEVGGVKRPGAVSTRPMLGSGKAVSAVAAGVAGGSSGGGGFSAVAAKAVPLGRSGSYKLTALAIGAGSKGGLGLGAGGGERGKDGGERARAGEERGKEGGAGAGGVAKAAGVAGAAGFGERKDGGTEGSGKGGERKGEEARKGTGGGGGGGLGGGGEGGGGAREREGGEREDGEREEGARRRLGQSELFKNPIAHLDDDDEDAAVRVPDAVTDFRLETAAGELYSFYRLPLYKKWSSSLLKESVYLRGKDANGGAPVFVDVVAWRVVVKVDSVKVQVQARHGEKWVEVRKPSLGYASGRLGSEIGWAQCCVRFHPDWSEGEVKQFLRSHNVDLERLVKWMDLLGDFIQDDVAKRSSLWKFLEKERWGSGKERGVGSERERDKERIKGREAEKGWKDKERDKGKEKEKEKGKEKEGESERGSERARVRDKILEDIGYPMSRAGLDRAGSYKSGGLMRKKKRVARFLEEEEEDEEEKDRRFIASDDEDEMDVGGSRSGGRGGDARYRSWKEGGEEGAGEGSEEGAEEGLYEGDEEEEEEDEQVAGWDSVCYICDDGGDLVCCDGPCMRSFHVEPDDEEEKRRDKFHCPTIGLTDSEVHAKETWLCPNCEAKQHVCFICHQLGRSEPVSGGNAGADGGGEGEEQGQQQGQQVLQEQEVFMCDVALCGHFYHPTCVASWLADSKRLPQGSEERIKELESVAGNIRAGIGGIQSLKGGLTHKEMAQSWNKGKAPRHMFQYPCDLDASRARLSKIFEDAAKQVTEQTAKAGLAVPRMYQHCHNNAGSGSGGGNAGGNNNNNNNNQGGNPRKIALSKLESILHAGEKARNFLARELEQAGMISAQALQQAMNLCPEKQLHQLNVIGGTLRVYLSPYVHGQRYTSFGRHFTMPEKLNEVVERLVPYMEDGDVLVDFCCGANHFSLIARHRLEEAGKRSAFANFDIMRPPNEFCFVKRDWFSVKRNQLPHSNRLIMGLNPPFGVRGQLASNFSSRAASVFRPKLIILIVPPETRQLGPLGYTLLWRDEKIFENRAFYLPGSHDKDNKTMNQWNNIPPPLYLWCRNDLVHHYGPLADRLGHTRGLFSSPRPMPPSLLEELKVATSISTTGAFTPPELTSPPPELRSTPPQLRSTPPELRSTPPELRSTPQQLRSTPPELRSTPPELTSPPPELRSTPPQLRSTPPELRSTPPQLRSTPPELRSTPPQLRSTPPELRSTPQQLRSTPPELRSSPPELRSTPPELPSPPPELRITPPELRSTPPQPRATPPELRSTPPELRSTPPELPSPPPELRITPPELRSTPPELRSTPPELRSTPPELRSTPPELTPPPPELRSTPPAPCSTPPALRSAHFALRSAHSALRSTLPRPNLHSACSDLQLARPC